MTEPTPIRTTRTRKPRTTKAPDEATAAAYDAAWQVEPPAGPSWTARPWVNPTERAAKGKAARKRVPRVSHAAFEPAAGRDPIAILAAQEEDRLQELVPLRHERMAESAFAYYRGTPAVMAFDLASTPRTDILVQASGDAHLSNFGLFASPERTLVFDANDFDETLPGPWEWDVKRLAASVVIAGRANGFSAAPESARRRWPRCAATASGWPATPACACSTSGTPRSPTPTSARRPRRPGCSRDAPAASVGRAWKPSSPRPAGATACAPSSR